MVTPWPQFVQRNTSGEPTLPLVSGNMPIDTKSHG
jgi:hypothetical protein